MKIHSDYEINLTLLLEKKRKIDKKKMLSGIMKLTSLLPNSEKKNISFLLFVRFNCFLAKLIFCVNNYFFQSS